MTEWPEASRLTDALDQRAATFEPSDGWEAIQNRVEDQQSASDVAEVSLLTKDDRRGARWTDPLKYVLVAATILLVSVFGIRALLDDGDGVRTDIADQSPAPTTAAPTSTQALPERTFSPVESCSTIGLLPTPSVFAVAVSRGDAVSVGGAAGSEPSGSVGTTPLSFVLVGDVAPLDLAASTFTPSRGDNEGTIFLDTQSVSGSGELTSLTFASLDSTCAPNAPTVVANGPVAASLSVEMTCAQTLGRGFHGLILVDAIAPPTADCRSNRPVFLLGNYAATDPSVLAWADRQGCVDPQTAPAAGDPVVTRWQQCESTLVHVQTPGDSAWDTDEIDGRPVEDFVKSIFELVG